MSDAGDPVDPSAPLPESRDSVSPCPSCSSLMETLEKLIEQWRKEADEALVKWPRGAILPSKKIRQCADQLAALRDLQKEKP